MQKCLNHRRLYRKYRDNFSNFSSRDIVPLKETHLWDEYEAEGARGAEDDKDGYDDEAGILVLVQHKTETDYTVEKVTVYIFLKYICFNIRRLFSDTWGKIIFTTLYVIVSIYSLKFLISC